MDEVSEKPAARGAPPASPLGDVIHAYSRSQAIEDGVLVDVTETARQAGFIWPFAMTAEVWGMIEHIPKRYRHEDIQGRLWDVLTMARFSAAKAGHREGPVFFEVILHQQKASRLRLKLLCGPGDDPNPVLTLMLPDQD